MPTLEPPTGHVFRRDGKRRSTWYAKYRLPHGRQVQRRIGPAWSERGRPPAGHYTKRTAEAWLREVLDEARRGTLPGLVSMKEGWWSSGLASALLEAPVPCRLSRSGGVPRPGPPG